MPIPWPPQVEPPADDDGGQQVLPPVPPARPVPAGLEAELARCVADLSQAQRDPRIIAVDQLWRPLQADLDRGLRLMALITYREAEAKAADDGSDTEWDRSALACQISLFAADARHTLARIEREAGLRERLKAAAPFAIGLIVGLAMLVWLLHALPPPMVARVLLALDAIGVRCVNALANVDALQLVVAAGLGLAAGSLAMSAGARTDLLGLAVRWGVMVSVLAAAGNLLVADADAAPSSAALGYLLGFAVHACGRIVVGWIRPIRSAT
jgi:hypothetical protein